MSDDLGSGEDGGNTRTAFLLDVIPEIQAQVVLRIEQEHTGERTNLGPYILGQHPVQGRIAFEQESLAYVALVLEF